MDWGEKTILITGCAGFIGNATCEFFLNKGAHVIGIDVSTAQLHHEHFQFHSVNICNKDELSPLHLMQADYCIHLAGIPHVKLADRNPEKAEEVNVKGTETILDTCKKMNVKRIIFASTVQVYGRSNQCITETSSLNPNTWYGKTKKKAEEVCRQFAQKEGIQIIIARQSNVYGSENQEYRLIPKTIQRVRTGKSPEVLGKGNTKKDFLYLPDVLAFYQKALEVNDLPSNPCPVNVVSEQSHTINEVVEIILNELNSDFKPIYVSPEYKEYCECYSAQKTTKVFGWKAQNTLSEGIRKIVSSI